MKNWKEEKPVFSTTPEWVLKMIPDFDGNIWALDTIFHNGPTTCIVLHQESTRRLTEIVML